MEVNTERTKEEEIKIPQENEGEVIVDGETEKKEVEQPEEFKNNEEKGLIQEESGNYQLK